jgi:hypothetical protein
MSYRLSGINPLAYVGVEPSQPPQMLVLPRAPLPSDSVGYNLGTYWLVAAPPPTMNWELWILVDLTAGVATWIQLYPGSSSGGAKQFDEDVGIAVPALGIINVFGGANMNTFGSGNTIVINLNETIHWPSTNSDGTIGAIYLGGSNGSGGYLFMHNYGVDNTWLGENAGNLTLTDGTANNNTGIGYIALNSLTTGTLNTAIGAEALSSLTSGDSNFAGGAACLEFLLTGSNNTCIGVNTGSNYVGAETENILIANPGVASETNTIRIGVEGTQTAAYMAGIYDEPIGTPNGVVYVDSTGKLGTGSPVPPPPRPGGVIITIFDSSGTFVINPDTQVVEVYGWNGGSGGGSGAQGANPGGGGGGSAGNCFYWKSPYTFFNPAGETVTVGAGGAGGAAQTGTNTAGNAGAQGGATQVNNIKFYNLGGGGGLQAGRGGMNNIGGGAGQSNIIAHYGALNSFGPASGGSNTALNAANIGNYNIGTAQFPYGFGWDYFSGTGGGAGAGVFTSMQTGGVGGSAISPDSSLLVLAGGTAGIADTNGGNGSNQPTSGTMLLGGTGGGGGGAMVSVSGGTGGNGGIPSGGGGGGGGSYNGTNSGAGGNGAHGRVMFIEYL